MPIIEQDYTTGIQKLRKNEALSVAEAKELLERPNDRPTCPNCNSRLSPAGGALDGSTRYWACWPCGYEQEDVPCEITNK